MRTASFGQLRQVGQSGQVKQALAQQRQRSRVLCASRSDHNSVLATVQRAEAIDGDTLAVDHGRNPWYRQAARYAEFGAHCPRQLDILHADRSQAYTFEDGRCIQFILMLPHGL
mmetsp:Transcript_285/g.766  ORF Transcript_285/g.766 Transcript_285/m.766 type:complete len:114 (+) Transcript_285:164-505(+)